MNDNLGSLPEENIEKIKVSNAEIVVHGTKEKPYFEIKYFDLSDNETHIGYSSYDLNIVFGYLEKYFEIAKVESSEYSYDDLISRKALLKQFIVSESGRRIPEYDTDNFPITISVKDVKDIIRRVATAFDKEKVKMRINENKDIDNLIDADHVIHIVEKGGIE